MKKSILVGLFISLVFLMNGMPERSGDHASMTGKVELTLLGPKQYLRTTGKPNIYTDAFPGRFGQGKLIVKNGDANGDDRISSAIIKINGIQIFGTSDFNQNVQFMERTANLQEENSISIELRSKPGSYLTIQIKAEIEAEEAEVIGPEGGTISTSSGIQAYIPAGATDKKIVVGISAVSQEQLRIDTLDGLEFLGAINFYIGDQVLRSNAELTILNLYNLPQTAKVYLGKVISQADKDLILTVDTAQIEGGLITTEQPAFPGAISSGIYLFYKANTFCGVPDHQNYFAGKINPTCREKLYLDVYLRFVAPQIFAANDVLFKRIEGILNRNDIEQNALKIASLVGTLSGLGKNSIEGLFADALGTIMAFDNSLFMEVADTWISLTLDCFALYLIDPTRCPKTTAFVLTETIFNAIASYNTIKMTRLMNENLIADKYLLLYYSYGTDQSLVAQSLGLSTDADIYRIIDAIAGTLIANPWWWPFGDYDAARVIDLIVNAQSSVLSIARSVDTDRDFIVNSKDNCITTYNPEQEDSNQNGIGDACEGGPPAGNVVPNPSFESGSGQWPDGWEPSYPSSANYIWDNTVAHTGSRSLGITHCTKTNTNAGWITTDFIYVDPTKEHEVSLWYLWSDTQLYDERAGLCVFEYDNQGNFTQGFGTVTLPNVVGSWQYYKWKCYPFNAKTVKIEIVILRAIFTSSNYNATLWFDDVKFIQK
jgi:hypothetical protein